MPTDYQITTDPSKISNLSIQSQLKWLIHMFDETCSLHVLHGDCNNSFRNRPVRCQPFQHTTHWAHCNTQQHTLQNIATYCSTLQHITARTAAHTAAHIAAHTAAHTAAHCNAHCNTHCNTQSIMQSQCVPFCCSVLRRVTVGVAMCLMIQGVRYSTTANHDSVRLCNKNSFSSQRQYRLTTQISAWI